jgi:RNA polymerase sigma factor (sigma-70 family)
MSTITADSDLALLRRFTDDRDQGAFTEIVRRYAGMVYAATFRVLHHRQLAEDVAQETFVRLLRRPDAVSVSLGGWLHRVATQLAIDAARSESSRHNREKVYQEQLTNLLDDPKPWKEISETIDLAMLELPEEARDLLVQHFILGRSQKEIAEERGVSVATLCRRVAEAMNHLKDVLRRQGVTVGALGIVGAFLSMRGAETISAALQQELGKMTLVAGLRRIIAAKAAAAKPAARAWATLELQLAALAGVAAVAGVIAVAVMRDRPNPAPTQPDPIPPARTTALR